MYCSLTLTLGTFSIKSAQLLKVLPVPIQHGAEKLAMASMPVGRWQLTYDVRSPSSVDNGFNVRINASMHLEPWMKCFRRLAEGACLIRSIDNSGNSSVSVQLHHKRWCWRITEIVLSSPDPRIQRAAGKHGIPCRVDQR